MGEMCVGSFKFSSNFPQEKALPILKGLPTIDTVQAFKKMDTNGVCYYLYSYKRSLKEK